MSYVCQVFMMPYATKNPDVNGHVQTRDGKSDTDAKFRFRYSTVADLTWWLIWYGGWFDMFDMVADLTCLAWWLI